MPPRHGCPALDRNIWAEDSCARKEDRILNALNRYTPIQTRFRTKKPTAITECWIVRWSFDGHQRGLIPHLSKDPHDETGLRLKEAFTTLHPAERGDKAVIETVDIFNTFEKTWMTLTKAVPFLDAIYLDYRATRKWYNNYDWQFGSYSSISSQSKSSGEEEYVPSEKDEEDDEEEEEDEEDDEDEEEGNKEEQDEEEGNKEEQDDEEDEEEGNKDDEDEEEEDEEEVLARLEKEVRDEDDDPGPMYKLVLEGKTIPELRNELQNALNHFQRTDPAESSSDDEPDESDPDSEPFYPVGMRPRVTMRPQTARKMAIAKKTTPSPNKDHLKRKRGINPIPCPVLEEPDLSSPRREEPARKKRKT
jgi:hypothetical protein